MSDEQLKALGLPRRDFLKKAAVSAFVAPVVVSFGLDGIAEASPTQCAPNQTFSNQFVFLSRVITLAEGSGAIAPAGVALGLLDKLTTAHEQFLSCDFADAALTLQALENQLAAQSGKHIDADLANTLTLQVDRLKTEVGSLSS
jgi:hypothetical protein